MCSWLKLLLMCQRTTLMTLTRHLCVSFAAIARHLSKHTAHAICYYAQHAWTFITVKPSPLSKWHQTG